MSEPALPVASSVGSGHGYRVTSVALGSAGVVLGAIPIIGLTTHVLGLLGLVLGLIPILEILAAVCGIVGIVFGLLGFAAPAANPTRVGAYAIPDAMAARPQRGAQAMGAIGTVLSVLALVAGMVGIVLVHDDLNQFRNDLIHSLSGPAGGFGPAPSLPSLPTFEPTDLSVPNAQLPSFAVPPVPSFGPLPSFTPPPVPSFSPLPEPVLPSPPSLPQEPTSVPPPTTTTTTTTAPPSPSRTASPGGAR